MYHSIYFFSYAVIVTVILIAGVYAQYTVSKREGAPFNFTFLKAVGGVAVGMYIGGGLTLYAYSGA